MYNICIIDIYKELVMNNQVDRLITKMGTIQKFHRGIVITGLTFCCISDGYIFGQMSGMLDALKHSDSSLPLSDEDISWIASTINITCIFGYIVVGILAQLMGRGKSTSILCIPVLGCWLVLYYVTDKSLLLLTRIVVGVSFGGVLSQAYVNIGEYLSPRDRQFYCNFMACTGTLLGVTLGHVFSLFMDWRKVALLGLIPSGLACVVPIFWVESPSWLASRGKFKECKKAFIALHGNNDESEAEIKNLIEYEKKKQCYFAHHNIFGTLQKILITCKKKFFWKITLSVFVVNVYRAAACRTLISTLAITMLQEITERKDILFFTLLVDGFSIIGASISCYLISQFKMRTLLFVSGTISNVLLFLLSATLYLFPNEGWYPWVKVIILSLYYVIANAGPYPVLDVFPSEVHPLEVKEFSIFLSGSLAGGVHFLMIKLAVTMFATIGYSGAFILNAVIVCMCLVFLWIYMPETRGRTLQEMEIFFKTGHFESPNNSTCETNEYVEKELLVVKTNETGK